MARGVFPEARPVESSSSFFSSVTLSLPSCFTTFALVFSSLFLGVSTTAVSAFLALLAGAFLGAALGFLAGGAFFLGGWRLAGLALGLATFLAAAAFLEDALTIVVVT